MTISSAIYNVFIRRNAVFVTTIFASAFALQLAFDSGSQKLWDNINRGRQWKDIKTKYVQKPEEEDGDDE